MGGRVCLACHEEPPRVDRVAGEMPVSGMVAKTLGSFIVVVKGTSVYHLRVPD